jgi:hypothetical protein
LISRRERQPISCPGDRQGTPRRWTRDDFNGYRMQSGAGFGICDGGYKLGEFISTAKMFGSLAPIGFLGRLGRGL